MESFRSPAPHGVAARTRLRAVAPEGPRSLLAFDAVGGPLVAICGLAGGAGTTLLAWMLADAAARESAAPVLLAELPSCAGGLDLVAPVRDARPLAHLADAPAWPGGAAGPRVATGPGELAPDALSAALATAQATHGLAVVDCGRLQAADARTTLALATHVIWTVPTGPRAGVTASTTLLDGALAPPPGSAVELIAGIATRPTGLTHAGQRALRRVAAARCERLVLVPHVKALAAGRLGPGPRRLRGALTAIAAVLHRRAAP